MNNVSAVIASHNRLNELSGCISSLLHAQGSHLEAIYVVDNGSTDGTRELLSRSKMLEGIPIFPILLPNNDYGVVARNIAFGMCRTEFILQIDSDVLIHPSGIQAMLNHFKDDVIGVGPQGFNVCKDWSNFNGMDPGIGGYVDTLTGFCWMFRNNKLWQYDWSYAPFWFEEAELCLRMRLETQMRFIKCPMVCTHICKRTSIDWDQHNKNLAKTVARYRPLVESGQLKLE